MLTLFKCEKNEMQRFLISKITFPQGQRPEFRHEVFAISVLRASVARASLIEICNSNGFIVVRNVFNCNIPWIKQRIGALRGLKFGNTTRPVFIVALPAPPVSHGFQPATNPQLTTTQNSSK